ncbi:MAG: glycosyltransferase, partial [Myxococcota bacterium]
PHPVNFFLLSPDQLSNLWAERPLAVRAEGKINVALVFWELPTLPTQWLPILESMDLIVAPSEFVKHAVMADVAGPALRDLGHPLDVPERVVGDRARWGIPEDVVAFVSSFEMASDINRKNPFAAIEAFEQALGGHQNARLIIKVNNSRAEARFAHHVDRLRSFTERNPNISLIEDVLSYPELLGLFASCDALVSLHRAEGLGLCPMEAMTLGKPVIATGWSGNLAFMTERNSCLVGHDLVSVHNATQETYSRDVVGEAARWAEPRVADAAHWMRRLVAEPELRQRIGERAAADMRDYQQRLAPEEIAAAIRNIAARRASQ